MSYTAYKLIKAADADALTTAITAAIAGGFQPLGAPLVIKEGAVVGQAMVQGSPDSGEVPSGSAVVAGGATVAVVNSAGADSHNGTATVTAGALTNIQMPATMGFVDQGDNVNVFNSAGADSHVASATVAAGVVSQLKLAATVAMVDQADAVAVHNSAGTNIAGAHTAEVAVGVLTDVKLAATVAAITNAQALVVPVTGVYVTTVTVNVANGVVTGIVLS